MTVRGQTELEFAPLPPRAPRRREPLSGRRRTAWLIVGSGAAGLLLVVSWSVAGALLAPGTDSTAARLAEWARFHGFGWVVSGLEQVQYQLDPPKLGGSVAGGIPKVGELRSIPAHGRAPNPIAPQVRPALPDEGVWQPLISVRGQPAIRAAFVRPDARHTSYLVGVAWLDQRLLRMVLHPGTQVPGGSGWSQPSYVPPSQRASLLATFNSGFTMVDANGGYWQDGHSTNPLVKGAASMVVYKDGRVDVARWPGGQPAPDVSAVRQNLGLLVDDARIAPDVNSTTTNTWGKTVGNHMYVWRTALGIRKDGSLVFVVGDSLSVQTLAKIVRDAGAVRAMELDINKAWTNFMTYSHPGRTSAVPHMLTPDEDPNPYRYLQPSTRDFVAVFAR